MSKVWWLHWLIPNPLTPPLFPTSGTLTLLPRRSACSGAQLRVQLCPLAQDSEMTPGPGLSTTAACSIIEVASQLTLGWGDGPGGLT